MKSKSYGVAAYLLVLLLHCASANAGSQPVEGDESGLWNADMLSVVVGTIIGVKADDPRRAQPVDYTVRLEPIATLAGHLDPSLHRELHLRLKASDATTLLAIHFVPKKGDLVMAVVLAEDTIYHDATLFMPDGVPLVVLDGVGDKRVVETLHRIQEARSHEKPAAPIIYESTGTTQPAHPASEHPPTDKSNTPPKKEGK
jgi:hypothetical protein